MTRFARLRSFNYRDLSFLYIACMVSIALVYTGFRLSEFYLGAQEASAVGAIQRIDQQRDLAARVERLAAATHDYENAIPTAIAIHQLIDAYSRMVLNHQEIQTVAEVFKLPCEDRPCAALARSDLFPLSSDLVISTLNDKSLPTPVRDAFIGQIAGVSSRYNNSLMDAVTVGLEFVRAKKLSNITFEIGSYFALMILLLIQGVYVFRPAIHRLNASLATRSDFLSRISHEIRNPMNSILGMADILKGTRLNFEQRQYVENLSRSGNALLDMLNNLIDFSVMEGGRLQLKSSPFDLFDSIDRCLNLIAIQAHHKNINVFLSIDPEVPNRLVGDSSRLDQVLINLLGNAVKFTEKGYLALNVKLQSEDEQHASLKFTVSDTGIGIKPHQLSEIFESFVQGDASIQRKFGGSGLGLSIAREIIRLMDGRLGVESEYGKGASFFFTVPFNKRKSQRGRGELSKPLLQLAAMRFVFLIAEVDADPYRESLSELGRGTVILNSTQALDKYLTQDNPHEITELVVDDSIGIIAMINCRNLADQFSLTDRCVALIRSNFTKENMDLLRRNGFTRFLIKPLKPWELLSPPAESGEEPLRASPLPSNDDIVEKLRQKRLKILLVDDSNDNLFLLKEVVGPLASVVHVAENGLQAVEKFRCTSYDVVLMDIQMPVMDGYTAIRKIREFEAGTGRSTPIFAVTAHSGLVDAQKCKEAGFTDRIVKPVLRSDIYKLLAQSCALDFAEKDSEQEIDLSPEYIAKLLPTYYKTRFEDLEKLNAALSHADFESLRRLGHKIKGGSASYGFKKVSQLSVALEQAAQNNDLKKCIKIVKELENLIRAESNALKRGPA